MIFPSRRNLVRTVDWNGQAAVRKLFDSPDDWLAEETTLRLLAGKIAVPRILAAVPGILLMEYLPFPTLLDELERQERAGFSAAPWLALRGWLAEVHRLTRLAPGDGNLRNFLWNGKQIYGLDFEGYHSAASDEAFAQIAAYILEYTPKDTPVKRQAAQILFGGSVDRARQALLERRSKRFSRSPSASFILLAGGKSSRMGCDKAALPALGTTLLELQLDKARLLGCGDVLVSGAREEIEGAKIIPDLYPGRGPLGGLHACLRAARYPRCVVLGVDMPLLPVCELHALLQDHMEANAEITLAVHGDRWQPLAGVYNSDLSDRIAPLIEASGAPVRALIQKSACRFRQTQLSEAYWANCNTPEAYHSIFSG